MEIEIEKRIGNFEYVVSVDGDFDYSQSAEFETGELIAYIITKYSICKACNQRDQILDSFHGIVADSAELVLTIYLQQQEATQGITDEKIRS